MQKLKVKNQKQIEAQIRAYLHKSDEAKFVHRLHGILLLLSDEKNNCANVATLFGNSPRSLSNWVHSINECGSIDALRDKDKPGRAPRLSAEQMSHLRDILQEHPSMVGVSANIWDGKSLSHYIELKYATTLQVRQCQRLFRKLGFSLKRARPMVAKGNPEKMEQSKKAFNK